MGPLDCCSWAVVMVLAYTTPHGWSVGAMIAYAAITNALLMTLYSMNNMPYSALGGVMTGDLDERRSSIPTASSPSTSRNSSSAVLPCLSSRNLPPGTIANMAGG